MANVRLSPRGLNIGFIVTSLVLISLFYTSYHSYQFAERTLQRYTRLERLLGKIEYENEVLNMSARLAALTGQPAWRDRHARFSGEIRALITETQKLPLEGQEKNIQALENARKTLTTIETKAMKNQAFLLQSTPYASAMKTFAMAKKDLTNALGDQTQVDLDAEMQRNRVAMVVSSICTVISLLAWSMVLSVLKSLTTRQVPLAPLRPEGLAYNDKDAKDNRDSQKRKAA
jgi:hypothetical protein